ncbi:MurR/RpiR family transcriptional regulator [Enterococcus canintestini]|uniref:Transcriptional regulator n=1 Tax=Enterococcus canintestini TaxID=317010 RepID=A0A267HP42_9ENTE|nr:SIS domain-containing protein [Enterococcus canintestini]PAB00012.1 transcriptional regulator [Enterococcus canintestini]
MDLEFITKGKQISDNDYHILKYLVEQTNNLEGVSLRKIAGNLYTSPATIVRLAQKLGFSGYLELFYFLKNQYRPTNQLAEAAIDITIDTKIITPSIAAMKQIYADNQHKFITIYAAGFSSIIAEYLHKKLLVNGIKTLFVNAADSSGIINNNTNNISMLISISKSGETTKAIEKMRFCQEKGIPNILFTGNKESLAAELATIIFEVPDERPLDSQNIHSNSFFGKLLLLLEYIVQEFSQDEIRDTL